MDGLLNPADPLERQRDKLLDICAALMRRVEQAPGELGNAYSQFERAALLEAQVRERTEDLERALAMLNESNAQLALANTEIERARSNLNEAIESVSEGFGLFDRDERLVLYNSRFCQQMHDVAAHLAPGLPFSDYVRIVSCSMCLAFPKGMTPSKWVERRMRRHRDERVVFNIALSGDRWMQVSEHRTREGGTVILQTDVTDIMHEQRRERAQLLNNQAKILRATLDHLAQGVCIFDAAAHLVGWNRKLEQMIELPLVDARVGTSFDDILDLMRGRMRFVELTGRKDFLDWSRQKGSRRLVTFELTDRDERTFSIFAQEMPDRGFVISFTDVTEEKRTSAALRDMNRTLEKRVTERTEELGAALHEAKRANESKNRFVAAASHDLLQPLSAAKLFLASLPDTEIDQRALQIVEKARGALTSVEEIIEALLDISKLDAGKAVFDIQAFPIQSVLSSLATELAPEAEKKGLLLRVMPSSVSVVSDPVFLRRIIQNLMTNAIRYTESGRILVGVRRHGDGTITIQVHDTGRGIKEEDQKRVFKEFAQVDKARSGSNGLGLGLAIVERACASLQHGLKLESELGKGSSFSVTLPQFREGPSTPVIADEAIYPEDGLSGKLILLVENDAALANAITLKFEAWGTHVVHASNGEEAIDILNAIALAPDIILLDYQLGGGVTGLDLYENLVSLCGKVPAFVISAARDPELTERCARLGLPLFRKPLDANELRRAMSVACR
ncbi:MAG: PAS-domain containing protein [Pseudomonadota bacterium]